jgi:hypothetical protein
VADDTSTVPRGWVYLIVNDLIPNRVKIGFTKRDPIERASELISTGTTGTFVVIYEALVFQPYQVEQEVHRRFAELNRGLEWFEVCPNRAKEEILTVAGSVLHENTSPRWHPSQPVPSQHARELLNEAKKAAEKARQVEAEARAKKAREDEEARLAAEAAETARQRKAEEERRQRELEEEKSRIEEQAIRAAEDEKRQLAIEEQERANWLLVSRVTKVVLAGVAIVMGVQFVGYATKQERDAFARHAATWRERSDRLAASLNAVQVTLADNRAQLTRLTAELSVADIKRKSLPQAVKQYQERQRAADARLAEHVDYLRNLSPSERAGSAKRLSDTMTRLRAEIQDAAEALREIHDDYAKASVGLKEIPKQIEHLRRSIADLSREESDLKRQRVDAEHEVSKFKWATKEAGSSR